MSSSSNPKAGACDDAHPHDRHIWYYSPDWYQCPGVPLRV